MLNAIKINDTIANKISYYLLLAFVSFLPFERFYSETILICLTIHTLIHATRDRFQQINRDTFWLSSLYILAFITISYSTHKSQGFGILGIQLALFLFPLLLRINSLDLNKYKLPLLLFFSSVCTLTIASLFIYNISLIYHNNRGILELFTADFINHNFSVPLQIHATYLSMYTTLSLACCIYLFSKTNSALHKAVYTLMMVILFAGIIQLASRSVSLALAIIASVLIPKFLLRKKYKWHFIVGLIAFLSLLTILSTCLGDIGTRNTTELKKDLDNSFSGNIAVEPRMARWKCALELIKKSPLIGYGIGSEIPKLKEKYFEKKYYISYINDLNAHNQYLSLLISLGAIGLFLYLYILFLGIRSSIQNKDFIFASFLVIIITVSLSENILSVNKGIFFVGFFLSFFLYSNSQKAIDK